MAGQVCDTCGYENPLGANFCSSCGSPLRDAADDATASHDPTATGEHGSELHGMLVVRQGAKRGSQILLDTDEVTIGRHPESDIFLDDITVSRRHATITRGPQGFRVSDAGSLNGTYVNRELVEAALLDDGDELRIGKFKLVYVALEAGE